MRFAYKVIDSSGFPQEGELDAPTEKEALRILFESGRTPLQIHRQQAPAHALRRERRSVRRADVVALIRELATLLGSGVGLSETLSTLVGATDHGGIREILTNLQAAVHSGDKFSAALGNASLDLPEYALALARAGEATGDLGGALLRCADQLEFEEHMKSRAREALTYPVILILTGAGAILFIFSFVVPRFATILRGKTVELPIISQWVMNGGMFINAHWGSLLVAALVFLAAAALLLRQPVVRSRFMALLFRLPGFSGWLGGAETARWTSTLAALVQSRVPILLAIELAAASVRLPVNAARLRSAGDDVRLGKRLSAALEERHLLEGSSLTMVKVGEHSGEVGAMLGHVAKYVAEQHHRLQRRLLALIEPVSILVIGLVLAVIMVGVVLAMASLTEIKL